MIVLEVHTFKKAMMKFDKMNMKLFFITKILKEQAYLFSLEIMIIDVVQIANTIFVLIY